MIHLCNLGPPVPQEQLCCGTLLTERRTVKQTTLLKPAVPRRNVHVRHRERRSRRSISTTSRPSHSDDGDGDGGDGDGPPRQITFDVWLAEAKKEILFAKAECRAFLLGIEGRLDQLGEIIAELQREAVASGIVPQWIGAAEADEIISAGVAAGCAALHESEEGE